ncbi:MAG: YlxR family protein [Eubacteriales bacterium]|nr:YlxR family protein [Eubacteriales bacterium]MCI7571163.1 YlxR family protein [Clostridiales bacterium]MDD7551281.1 YlxR family protein [Clostridia bacterium]MDY5754286.1 YlxR family protein [Eubacteriales bacterium]
MPKKIPMRMCVGCREMKPKRELIRVVRSQDGNVTVDFTGKAAGRGAYVCRSVECLERAIKTRGLDRALEHKIEDTVFLQLKEELQAGDR